MFQVVNGFSGQSDPEIKGKVITRLQNITEMQKILMTCLAGRSSGFFCETILPLVCRQLEAKHIID